MCFQGLFLKVNLAGTGHYFQSVKVYSRPFGLTVLFKELSNEDLSQKFLFADKSKFFHVSIIATLLLRSTKLTLDPQFKMRSQYTIEQNLYYR